MTVRYSGPGDPEKGMPHRHTREKIRLMLAGPLQAAWLTEMLNEVAARRPDEVLDAVTTVIARHEEQPDAEFRHNAADFIARNEKLRTMLFTGEFPAVR